MGKREASEIFAQSSKFINGQLQDIDYLTKEELRDNMSTTASSDIEEVEALSEEEVEALSEEEVEALSAYEYDTASPTDDSDMEEVEALSADEYDTASSFDRLSRDS